VVICTLFKCIQKFFSKIVYLLIYSLNYYRLAKKKDKSVLRNLGIVSYFEEGLLFDRLQEGTDKSLAL
jgi:hypothetical protein